MGETVDKAGAAADPLLFRPPLYVVRISGTTADGAAVNGTGFLVTANGHVVTCRHVVYPVPGGPPLAQLKVHLPYPAEQPAAYGIHAASQEDIAVLESLVQLAAPTPQALLHPDWRTATGLGDPVTVWGFSAAEYYEGPQRFDCTVSGFSEPNGRIGLNGDINPGDSGAPVLNAARQVIGIAQVKDPKRSGQAMAIPVSLLKSILAGIEGVRQAPESGGPGQRVFLAPKPPVDHTIVGRDRLLGQLKSCLVPGSHLALCFKPGVGKSALAIALANDPEVGNRFPGGVLWASLNLHPNVLTELKKWGFALGIPAETMLRLNSAATATATDGVAELEAVEEQWANEITNVIGERCVLLVIDDAWDFASARMLALNAPNCAHLITTREKTKVAERFGKRFIVTVVDELSEDDGVELLGQMAPHAVEMFPDKVREVVRAVGGLPQGLLLLGSYLGQMSASRRERRILDAFRNIQDNLHEHLQALDATIAIGYEALPSDETRRALQALSTFRPKPNTFTEAAALALLDCEPKVLDDLDDSGLIETLSTPGDAGNPPYTMHRTIADFVHAKLSPAEAEALHARAAAYFRGWLHAYDEKELPREHYLYQYRYEEPAWQLSMDEYLYHLARSGDTGTAILAFAEIYFDAFWWWGCYIPFPFCSRLLKQASLKRLVPDARRVLDLLVDFDEAYPKETERSGTAGWDKVEASLKEIRRLGGLDGDTADLDSVRRHVRAVTDIFLAEACRFGRKDYAQALHWYADAGELFPEGDWNRPWISFHIGDTYLEQGNLDAAAAHCESCLLVAEAPGLALKERDNEIIANACRLRAEILLARQRYEASLVAFEQAALHAYAFQAIPAPPDDYTVKFYGMVTTRIAEDLLALHAAQPALAVHFCLGMFDYWSSYRKLAGRADPMMRGSDVDALLRQHNLEDLLLYLFPSPPAAADMHVAGSAYFNEAITVFNEKIGAA